MVTCKEVVHLLNEYLEANLKKEAMLDLDQHLSDCPECLCFINTYRKTVQVCKKLQAKDIPEALHTKLWEYLEKRTKESR